MSERTQGQPFSSPSSQELQYVRYMIGVLKGAKNSFQELTYLAYLAGLLERLDERGAASWLSPDDPLMDEWISAFSFILPRLQDLEEKLFPEQKGGQLLRGTPQQLETLRAAKRVVSERRSLLSALITDPQHWWVIRRGLKDTKRRVRAVVSGIVV